MILCYGLFMLSISILSVLTHYPVPEASSIPAPKERIQEINNKIDKIAQNLLSQSSLHNRDYIVSNLEKKLLEAARHLGSKGKEHVQFILEGIKMKAFNDTKKKELDYMETNARKELHPDKHRSVKKQLDDDLSDKIESFIESELENVKTLENKQNLLGRIKEKLLESVSKKRKEILISMRNENNTRRIAYNYNQDDIEYYKNNEADFNSSQDPLYKNFSSSNAYPRLDTGKALTTPSACHNIDTHTCRDIKNLNKLKCRYDLGYITLEKICDGASDCPSQSDEKNCARQVINKIQNAELLMDNVESLIRSNCFEDDDTKPDLSSQAGILQSIQERRLIINEKYEALNWTLDKNAAVRNKYETHIKTAANEVGIILSALALTLEGMLCSQQTAFDTRRRNDIFDMDIKEADETIWPPKACNCKEEYCFNCTITCKRICWQKYSLAKWNCESVNNTAMVSLNALCDGKLDCYDESDERDCVQGAGYGRFEASEMYSKILKMLHVKALKERLPVQKKILFLNNLIMRLQKLITKYTPNEAAIKRLRDKCYSTLSVIYSDILSQTNTLRETEDAYTFLLAINQNLGTALKRSHTGNIKIIKGTECHCRNGTCSISFCSKVCIKACAAEPKLMKYYCGGQLNRSIAMNKICDGKEDCPHGIDEVNCKKDDICRRHHLIILRNNLQNVGENMKGTALGELLFSWKAKVISTVKFAENNERPTPKIMKGIVEEILRELVLTYGSVKNYRRSNTEYALGEFVMISQLILESLKTCGK